MKCLMKYFISIITCSAIICTLCLSFECALAADEGVVDECRLVVSLGDSFSSGEGIPPFYGSDEGKDKWDNPDWWAHRSLASWPGQLIVPGIDGKLANHKDVNWFFEATSGATTEHLKNAFKKKESIASNQSIIFHSKKLSPQLDIFKRLQQNEVDYVTITIGGNDMGFADIITAGAVFNYLNINSMSKKLKKAWNEFNKEGETSIKNKLKQAYYDIVDAAGKQAKIIVAGYPKLVNEHGTQELFKIGFMEHDAKVLDENIELFNEELRKLTEECRSEGMNIVFVDVSDEFDKHEAYTDQPYINEIKLGIQDSDDVMGFPSSAYSMHPNEKGAKVYSRCVQKAIGEPEQIMCPIKPPTREEMLNEIKAYAGNDYVRDPFYADFNGDGLEEVICEYVEFDNKQKLAQQYFVYSDGENIYKFDGMSCSHYYKSEYSLIPVDNRYHFAVSTEWRANALGGFLSTGAIYDLKFCEATECFAEEFCRIYEPSKECIKIEYHEKPRPGGLAVFETNLYYDGEKEYKPYKIIDEVGDGYNNAAILPQKNPREAWGDEELKEVIGVYGVHFYVPKKWELDSVDIYNDAHEPMTFNFTYDGKEWPFLISKYAYEGDIEPFDWDCALEPNHIGAKGDQHYYLCSVLWFDPFEDYEEREWNKYCEVYKPDVDRVFESCWLE